MEPVATAGAFAVALGLVEVIKVLVGKLNPDGKKDANCPFDASGSIGRIHRISEIISRTDADGAPMIYGTAGHRALLTELQKMNGHLALIVKGVNGGTR